MRSTSSTIRCSERYWAISLVTLLCACSADPQSADESADVLAADGTGVLAGDAGDSSTDVSDSGELDCELGAVKCAGSAVITRCEAECCGEPRWVHHLCSKGHVCQNDACIEPEPEPGTRLCLAWTRIVFEVVDGVTRARPDPCPAGAECIGAGECVEHECRRNFCTSDGQLLRCQPDALGTRRFQPPEPIISAANQCPTATYPQLEECDGPICMEPQAVGTPYIETCETFFGVGIGRISGCLGSCADGVCTVEPPICDSGQRKCIGDTQYAVCKSSNGLKPTWSDPGDCMGDWTCKNGECGPTLCVLNEIGCSGNIPQVCGQIGTNLDFTTWHSLEQCPTGSACDAGLCVEAK